MPYCSLCERESAVASGCRERRLVYGVDDPDELDDVDPDELVEPYRYGEEPRFEGTEARGTCPECDVAVGEYHHPFCRIERCPECGEQLQFCDCEPRVLTRGGA
ncbi:MAG: hypothetical protein ABEJ74_04320 [Haloferacaceae archaeon]